MTPQELFNGAFDARFTIKEFHINGYVQFNYGDYRGKSFFVRIMNDAIIHGEIVMRKGSEVTYPSSISISTVEYLIQHYKEVQVNS